MKSAALLLAVCCTLAHAAPEALRGEPRDGMPGAAAWQEWGSGEMTWFGFALYRATLWVAGGRTGMVADDLPAAALALELDYRRDIPREQLVRTSLDEMRRLGADAASLQRWEPELRRVFPDVRAGERIVGVLLPGQGARFYHQDRARGAIGDPEFARRFFAIWLDPASRSPALRAALLKLPGD